jgi:hypothetical protein
VMIISPATPQVNAYSLNASLNSEFQFPRKYGPARSCEREEMEFRYYGHKLWCHIYLKLNENLNVRCDCGGGNMAKKWR